jgi:monoamine oxidase
MSGSLIHTLARRFGSPLARSERREFVRQMLAAGLAGAAVCRPCQGAVGSKKSIIIVGAGFSGLACGYELVQAGHEVTLIEARSRVGGRVFSSNAQNHTEFVAGKNIEYGAELIGSNHPLWMHYAEHFDLELLDVTEDEDAESSIYLQGQRISLEAAEELWSGIEGALESLNELAVKVHADQPWNSPHAAELDQQSVGGFLDSLPVAPLMKHALHINLMADNGQEPRQQSLLGFLAQVQGGGVERYWTESEVYRCRGGNDRLALALSEAIGRERILLGNSVTAVKLQESGVSATLSTGESLRADYLVLSAAPSVWDRIRMEPALPEWLKPQMGWNTKYFALVKDRFWLKRQPPLSQYCLSDGHLQLTWEGTDNQQPEDVNGQAVLVGFSGGPGCRKTAALSVPERDSALKLEFERLLPGFEACFLGSTYMNWPSEPWTRASYSFPAPGEVTKLGPWLTQAHCDGRLFIAGEHSCYQFVGYMEGALQSGHRAARQILQS